MQRLRHGWHGCTDCGKDADTKGEGGISEEIPKPVLVLQSWAKSDFASDPNTVMHCKLGARASPL